tara:strand:+ start:315 stop:509 length:195 start_codon:yes stop_codon:yes gene_type:complete
MEEIIKKKLAKNWFKYLQEMICQEIEELEGKKIYSNILIGKEEKSLKKEEESLEFTKMEKFLKK